MVGVVHEVEMDAGLTQFRSSELNKAIDLLMP